MIPIKEVNNPQHMYVELLKLKGLAGFKFLAEHQNILRETIIREGKKARAEEKKIQMWAKLEAHDEIAALLEFLISKMQELAQDGPEEIMEDA